MSHRSGKREKRAKGKPAETETKKPLALLRRRRVTIAAAAGLLTMLLIAFLGGRQPPRISLINRTFEPLNGVRIDFPGGSVTADPIPPEGGKATLTLRPDPAAPKPTGPGPITLEYRVGTGPPNKFVSRIHGQALGSHDILTIVRMPDGSISVVVNQPGGQGVRFRDLLRNLGLNI